MRRPDPRLGRALALVDAGRRPEGILLLNQLAAQDEPGALLTLAEWKWIGTIVPQDLRQARELYRRADEAGHPGAAAAFTNLLGSGIAGPRDWPLAIRRLRAEARQDRTRRAALSLVEKMKLDANGDPIVAPEGRSLSQSPQVTLFPKLLTPTECEYLRRVADPGFQPSVVIDVKTGRDYADPIRTSDGSTMHWLIEDPAVHALNRRLAAAAGVGAEQGEPLQILRYRPEQQYRSHMDFVPGVDNQRVLTALVYLNEGYGGGETSFVKTGLAVKGATGDAIVFRNAGVDRRAEPMSEHAGLPVTSGTKFLASRWMRESRFVP